jgi:hypothetical protein
MYCVQRGTMLIVMLGGGEKSTQPKVIVGTTYMGAEIRARRWFGIEVGPPNDIPPTASAYATDTQQKPPNNTIPFVRIPLDTRRIF